MALYREVMAMRYINYWRYISQTPCPCYVYVPKMILVYMYVVICMQWGFYCLLPWHLMGVCMPVGGIVLYQLVMWLKVYRCFGYAWILPIVGVVSVSILMLMTKHDFHQWIEQLFR